MILFMKLNCPLLGFASMVLAVDHQQLLMICLSVHTQSGALCNYFPYAYDMEANGDSNTVL